MTHIALTTTRTVSVPLMKLIRDRSPMALISEDVYPKEHADLCKIKEIAFNNDRMRDELKRLRPDHAAFYDVQWQQGEDELDKRAAKLKPFINDFDPEA